MTLSTTSGFPTSLDSLTDPTSTDKMNATDIEHDLLHQLENDAIEHLQTKVGIDSSAVTTSHDYKLSGVTGTDKAVSRTGTETLTNKTLTTARLNTPNFNEAVNMTSTSTELNFLDTSVAGTAVASKAAVLGSNKELDEFHTAALYLGAGAGTQVTSTAAELNILDGVTANKDELNITDNGQTTEKVLNVQSKCYVYLSADQDNIVNQTPTKILFDSELYDIGSDFASNQFTAPVTGYYLVIGSVQWELGTIGDQKILITYIYVNGSQFSKSINTVTTSGTNNLTSCGVSSVVYVPAGQAIALYAWHNHGDNTPDIESGGTFMCVHLLSV